MQARRPEHSFYSFAKTAGVVVALVGLLPTGAGAVGLVNPYAPMWAEARVPVAAGAYRTVALDGATYYFVWEAWYRDEAATYFWNIRVNVTNEAGVAVLDQTLGWSDTVACSGDGCGSRVNTMVAVVGLPRGNYTFDIAVLSLASTTGQAAVGSTLSLVDPAEVAATGASRALAGMVAIVGGFLCYKLAASREGATMATLREVAAKAPTKPRVVEEPRAPESSAGDRREGPQ